MNILGLSWNYHDASACLLRDGAIVAAAEEERFTRVKHDARFPRAAIRYCLAEAGIAAADIDLVAFYEKPALKLERALQVAKRHLPQSAASLAAQYPRLIEDGFGVEDALAARIGYTGRVVYCEHHLSHAASAFLVSPFAEAAILVADGVGEWATTSEFHGAGNTITPLREIHYPDSLGLLYASLTAFLGFRVNDDEYKVMGLASYGIARYRDRIEKLIALFADGSFALDQRFFAYTHDAHAMFAPAMAELLGPLRLPGQTIGERHRDIAASLQAVTEDAMVALAASARAATGSRNLCLAGGVALNCVANSQILARAGIDELFVQPAAGDSGAAMGAALWSHHEVSGAARTPPRHHTLLGPAFPDELIGDCLNRFAVAFERVDTETLCRRTAEAIQRGLIVGWFQGRMEFGPRALGSRSILANPCLPEMKDILNARVKFRGYSAPSRRRFWKSARQITSR